MIAEKELPAKITSKLSKKAWVSNNLFDNESTIVYCNYPSECRKVADAIGKIRYKPDIETPEQAIEFLEIEEAIEFLQDHVHEQYYLIDHLRKGIGYHHGKMPQFVRFCVKELYINKNIDILCCTSTLLEDVNLPAKNIVLLSPRLGRRKPMDKSSVLNLAGRAGRLMKDYYGNIYCIDFDSWESGKNSFDGKIEGIQSSAEDTLVNHFDELLKHINTFQNQPTESKNIESVANKSNY